jgi:hypothetical protein
MIKVFAIIAVAAFTVSSILVLAEELADTSVAYNEATALLSKTQDEVKALEAELQRCQAAPHNHVHAAGDAWRETADEFCTYLEEDRREPEGSVWDLLCLGINGRTREYFDVFFMPGLQDGSCPGNYVCNCR